METFRFLKNLVLVGLLFPVSAFSYSDKTTHPALTQEIIKLYNSSFQNQISDEEKGVVIQGSIDEDSGIRWLHHFFDPIHKNGLALENKNIPKNPQLALIAAAGRGEFVSAKNWGTHSVSQAGVLESATAGTLKDFYSSKGDFSWERAIYEYVWGDKKRGLLSLGHVLHLLEDMTVPDHTRNDPHPVGSPYEKWAKKFDRTNTEVKILGENPIILNSLENYFNAIASYSNNNFFSKDSICKSNFKLPQVDFVEEEKLSDGFTYKFGYKKLGRVSYRLASYSAKEDWLSFKNQNECLFYLDDNSSLIFSDYWSLLSKQAVLHGAGVIKLFFDEVEKEKESKILYNKNRSWLTRQVDKFKSGAFAIAGILYGSIVKVSDLDIDDSEIPPSSLPLKESLDQNIKLPEKKPEEQISEIPQNKIEEVKPSLSPLPVQAIEISTPLPEQLKPSPSQQQEISSLTSSISSSPPVIRISRLVGFTSGPSVNLNSDTLAPDAPSLATSTINSTSTTISLTGTAEAGSHITQDFSSASTTADSAGNWSLNLENFSQGSTTVQFFSTDSEGNQSPAAQLNVSVDSLGPSSNLEIPECQNSLSANSCLLAQNMVTINVSSDDQDFDHFEVTCQVSAESCEGFSFAESATTTTYNLSSEGSQFTFTARAVDTQGNIGKEKTQRVKYYTRPIVINEIAWTGTSASQSNDEWIELFNSTSENIDLSGWVLRSQNDNSPYINLSGIISGRSYFLLERTDDTTVNDVSANQIYTGALSNSGEVLELSHSSTTIDGTPSSCAAWCGGDSSTYKSMERYDFYSTGTDSTNWGTSESFVYNGENSDGADIKGTPGRRNSLNYYIYKQNSISQDRTLTQENSPYVIPNITFTIESRATLNIEPGVVIKSIAGQSKLLVRGTLEAMGTSENRIIFTSFADDESGGDTNLDRTDSFPNTGDWYGIWGESGSVVNIRNSSVMYGGKIPTAGYGGSVKIENGSLTIENTTLEKSGSYGARIKNTTASVNSSIFRQNTVSAGYGIYIEDSSGSVRNSTFENNIKGIFIDNYDVPGNQLEISGNNLTGNTQEAISFNGSGPSFSNNEAAGNGTNGILFQGAFSQNYSLSPDLPYIIRHSDATVSAGKTLTVLPGTIIKFYNQGTLKVLGGLQASGTQEQEITLTSLMDDDVGGDTNNDATTTSPLPEQWARIYFDDANLPSVLSHVNIKYGGKKLVVGQESGVVLVENSQVDISNSQIENNYSAGINFIGAASSSISNSTITDHQTPGSSTGLLVQQNADVTLRNVTFSNNKLGIWKIDPAILRKEEELYFEGNEINTNPENLFP